MDADLEFIVYERKQLDWGDEDKRLFAILFPLIRAAALTGILGGLDWIAETGVGVDMGIVNQAAVEWARNYCGQLIRQINGTTRRFVQAEVANWIESGEPLDTLRQALTPMFGRVRAQMIAVTEVTNAFAQGNDIAWLATDFIEEFDVMTAEDDSVCPICLGKVGENPHRIGDPSGQPSFHVRCRCYKRPIVKGL